MRDATSPAADIQVQETDDGPQDRFIRDTSQRIRIVSKAGARGIVCIEVSRRWQKRRKSRRMLTLHQLPGDSPTAASFEFLHEDHTLGNALRYVIMKKYVTSAHVAENSDAAALSSCQILEANVKKS